MQGGFVLKGVDALARRFAELGVSMQPAMKEAVTSSSKVIVQAAKANIRPRPQKRTDRNDPTGTLKRSIGFRVVRNKKTGAFIGIVGPRRGVVGFARSTRFATKAKRRPKPATAEDQLLRVIEGRRKKRAVKRVATRYAHLVEKGTRRSRAFPFLRPAIDKTKGAVTVIISSTLRSALEREAVRLGRGDVLR